MLWLQVRKTQDAKLWTNISFLWGMAVTLIETLHIQVCVALGCISQSWMPCAAIGWATERAEYCAVRGGGGALYLLCALPFNLCSQQNEWLSRATQHPRLQHPADDSAPRRRGREKKKCRTEKGRCTDEKRLKGEEEHRRSKSWKWKELSKHHCLPEDHCSCTKSGAVRPTLSKAVSERGKGAGGEKEVIWRADLINLDKQGWEPQEPLCRQIKLHTGKVPSDHRSEPASSEEWRKTDVQELSCWFPWGEASHRNSDYCTAEYSSSLRCPRPKSSSVLPRTCRLPVNVFSACTPTARQLNTLMVDAKGRNMKCLTFFLMLPESVKSKSSKSSKKGNASGSSKLPPVCYEIITLRSKKKKKMAADIFPTKKPASTTTVQQYQQQNLNNNNTIQNCNWQGLYSTIRER